MVAKCIHASIIRSTMQARPTMLCISPNSYNMGTCGLPDIHPHAPLALPWVYIYQANYLCMPTL